MYEVVQKTARGRTANGKKSRKSNPVSMPVADFSRMRAYIQKKESANAARNVIQMVPDLSTVAYNRVLDLLQLRKWLYNQQEARDFIKARPQGFRWMFHKNNSIMVKNIANYFLNKNPVTLKSIGLAPALLALLLQPAEIPDKYRIRQDRNMVDYMTLIHEYYRPAVAGESGLGIQIACADIGTDIGKIDPRDSAVNLPHRARLTMLSMALREELLTNAFLTTAITIGDMKKAVHPAVTAGAATTISSPGAVRNVNWGADHSFLARQMSDDILAGAAQFNAMVNPVVPQFIRNNAGRGTVTAPAPLLPDVEMTSTLVGASTEFDDRMHSGLAAGRAQIIHEYGHHLENHLGVNDFVMLHNFLRARSRPGAPGGPADPAVGMKTVAWNLLGRWPFVAKGYDAELPPMVFQNRLSRSPLIRSNHSVMKYLLSNIGNYALSLGLKGVSRLARLIPFMGRVLPAQEVIDQRAQRFVDDFYLQDSNSESTSYATFTEEGWSHRTEFLSTTAELFATRRGLAALIQSDPLRAALFLYLANRTIYQKVKKRFDQLTVQNRHGNQDLDQYIHVIQ